MLLYLIVLAAAPCETPPENMACIEAGPALVGNSKGAAIEKPERTIELSTYYLDKYEVTIADYNECVKAGACRALIHQGQNIMKPFVEDKKPAVPIDWKRARDYCAFAGKRLPTEFEWEKAARGEKGDIYPWGNDEPTCDKAVYRACAPKGCKPYPGKKYPWDCSAHDTKDVGSYPAGHYGIFDMAGNGYEWTATWASRKCGENCRGQNPRGPCDGANPCKGHAQKVLKGGSWYWPKDRLRGSHRRFSKLQTKGHRLSFRCASSHPWLARFPALLATKERAVPPLPSPPSDDELALFNKVGRDNTMKKKPCAEAGRAFVDCRDPSSYIRSNEPKQHLWRPYIENLGGGYVGVGADQNYSFIGLARPKWSWIFDYDPAVIRLHHVLRALILKSETPTDFVATFDKATRKDNAKYILETYEGSKKGRAYREAYLTTRKTLSRYFKKALAKSKSDDSFGWLRNRAHYDYVRTMYQQGRIVLRDGDMLGKKAFFDIGTAAKALDVPVRIYYSSNAPELWYLTKQYRKNVQNLPFDDKSIVLQTTSGLLRRMTRGKKKQGYWHYNVQSGLLQQERLGLRGYNSLRKLIDDHVITDQPALSISGLRSE